MGYDFAADTVCVVPADGCTRWKALPPLTVGEVSGPVEVGFDLDPSVSSFRSWLLLVADLRNDTGEPPSIPRTGIPFGPYGLFNLAGFDGTSTPTGTEAFSLGMDSYSASNLIYRLVAARAKGVRVMLALTGGHDEYLTDGVFDRSKWEAKLQTYNTSGIKSAIAAGVADGTIVGASVMDEPYVSGLGDGNTWGPPGTMTKARVDSMCAYVKAMFPTLPVGVVHAHNMFEPAKSYHECQFIVTQYASRYGDVTAFRDDALAQAARDGIAMAFSLNLLNGGEQAARDGLW